MFLFHPEDVLEHLEASNIDDMEKYWEEEREDYTNLTFEEFIGDEVNRYLMDEKGTVFNKGVLEPITKDRYCLSWKNYGMQDVQLSYNTQLVPQFENLEKNRIPANYRVSGIQIET